MDSMVCDIALVDELRCAALSELDRIVGLFAWLDVTGSGAVTRQDFRKALPMLLQMLLHQKVLVRTDDGLLHKPSLHDLDGTRTLQRTKVSSTAATPLPIHTLFTATAAAGDASARRNVKDHEQKHQPRRTASKASKLSRSTPSSYGGLRGGGMWTGVEMDVLFGLLDCDRCGSIEYDALPLQEALSSDVLLAPLYTRRGYRTGEMETCGITLSSRINLSARPGWRRLPPSPNQPSVEQQQPNTQRTPRSTRSCSTRASLSSRPSSTLRARTPRRERAARDPLQMAAMVACRDFHSPITAASVTNQRARSAPRAKTSKEQTPSLTTKGSAPAPLCALAQPPLLPLKLKYPAPQSPKAKEKLAAGAGSGQRHSTTDQRPSNRTPRQAQPSTSPSPIVLPLSRISSHGVAAAAEHKQSDGSRGRPVLASNSDLLATRGDVVFSMEHFAAEHERRLAFEHARGVSPGRIRQFHGEWLERHSLPQKERVQKAPLALAVGLPGKDQLQAAQTKDISHLQSRAGKLPVWRQA